MVSVVRKMIGIVLVLLSFTSVTVSLAASEAWAFVISIPDGIRINPQTVCREAFCVRDTESLSEVLITDVLFYPGKRGEIKLFSQETLSPKKSYRIEAIGLLDENGDMVSLCEEVVAHLELDTALDSIYLGCILEQQTEETGFVIHITLANSSKTSYEELDCYLAFYEGTKLLWLKQLPVSLAGESEETVSFSEIPESVLGAKQRKIFVFDKSLQPIKNSGYDIGTDNETRK